MTNSLPDTIVREIKAEFITRYVAAIREDSGITDMPDALATMLVYRAMNWEPDIAMLREWEKLHKAFEYVVINGNAALVDVYHKTAAYNWQGVTYK